MFRKVTVKRLSYSQRNASSEFPLDAKLSLNDDQYSDGVRKLVVTDAIDRSYDSVVKRHCKNYPGIVAKHQAIKLVEDTAQDLSSFMSSGQQKMSKRMTFREVAIKIIPEYRRQQI